MLLLLPPYFAGLPAPFRLGLKPLSPPNIEDAQEDLRAPLLPSAAGIGGPVLLPTPSAAAGPEDPPPLASLLTPADPLSASAGPLPGPDSPPATRKSPRLACRASTHSLVEAMARKASLRAGGSSRALEGHEAPVAVADGTTAALRRIIAKGATLGIKLDEEEARSFATFREISGHSA